MKTDLDFAIWCARKCLHLWNAPQKVKKWLENPKQEKAARAAKAAARAAVDAAWAAKEAWAVEAAADAPAGAAAWAAVWAAKALNTTVTDLGLEYVKTWTDKELGKADDNWIEYATVEILDRENTI